jgi:hypothetical protein
MTACTYIPEEVLNHGAAAVELYQQIIAAGETERWATMCALKSPPGSRNTDRAFCEGQRRKMDNMAPLTRRRLVETAKEAGIQTDGKFYMSGLGSHINPAAWVSSAEDVITSCKVQNKGVEGVLNYKVPRPHEGPPPAGVPLAEHLVQEFAHKELQADPALAEKVRKNPKHKAALREKVIAKYGRKPKRR